jgi:xanthine dehydrogenase accessory factor
VRSLFERLAANLRGDRPAALATCIDGTGAGAKLLVDDDGTDGDLGSPGLNHAVQAEARALLDLGETAIRTFGADGEPVGVEVKVFIESFAPKPNMYVFGAIDFSRAMAKIGKYLGYRVTVVDARPIFATKRRIPDADEVVVAWPDEFLREAPVNARTVLVVLTHDVKFDVPLLQVALQTEAGYIGAMGSRRTHANRIAALREAGIGDGDLARISAPIGLDIGARTPEETAISIAAEIVALRSGRAGGRLREGTAPVHGSERSIAQPAPLQEVTL